MAKPKASIPSVLAFEKKLVPSDGYMYGTMWEQRTDKDISTPLKINTKSVRGTISNRLDSKTANDPLKLDQKVEKANLQTVDACSLNENQDTLHLHFTLKVLGNLQQPAACNHPEFLEQFKKVVSQYTNDYGFQELAYRYAYNLANARYLWRNRVGAEKIEVHIKDNHNKAWIFNAYDFPLNEFEPQVASVKPLAETIANALKGDSSHHLLLDINVYAKVGRAQEVYPSEELILDKGKGNKSKTLYQVDSIAAMHTQKLGNAIRTIDTWYEGYDSAAGLCPIAIEPYGSVTSLGRAFRKPTTQKDFYSLFNKFSEGRIPENIDDFHYVMAVLVRGGVFGANSEKE